MLEEMLGDPVSRASGKVTGQRVLEVLEEMTPQVEISISGEGKLRGDIEFKEMWTYCTEQRSDGVEYAEGYGVMMTKGGSNEVATMTGQGVGRMTESGIAQYRGTYFYSTSSTGKLAYLNNLVAVFEYDVDKEGNYNDKTWEWK